MDRRGMLEALLGAAMTGAALPALAADDKNEAAPAVGRKLLLEKALAGVDGKQVVVVSLTFPPGAASAPHRHPGPVFGYVLEGSFLTQLEGEAPVAYKAGEMFYEEPNHPHLVSRSASKTEPARVLAFLVLDRGAAVSIPLK